MSNVQIPTDNPPGYRGKNHDVKSGEARQKLGSATPQKRGNSKMLFQI